MIKRVLVYDLKQTIRRNTEMEHWKIKEKSNKQEGLSVKI